MIRITSFVTLLFLIPSVALAQQKGDVNRDGAVTNADAVLLEVKLAGTVPYYDINADVDGMGNADGIAGDGIVTEYDLYRLKKCLAKLRNCSVASDWNVAFPIREFKLDMKCTTPPISCTPNSSNPDCGKCPIALNTYNTYPFNQDFEFKNVTLTEASTSKKWTVDYERKGFTNVSCAFPSLNFDFDLEKKSQPQAMFNAVTSLDLTKPYRFEQDYLSRTAYYKKVRLQTSCSTSLTPGIGLLAPYESLFRNYLMTVIYRAFGTPTYETIGFARISTSSNLMSGDASKIPSYQHFLLQQRTIETDDYNPYFSSPGQPASFASMYQQLGLNDYLEATSGGIVQDAMIQSRPQNTDWYAFYQELVNGTIRLRLPRYLDPESSIRYHLLYEFGYDSDKQLGQRNLDVARNFGVADADRPWKLIPTDFDLSMRAPLVLGMRAPLAVPLKVCQFFDGERILQTPECAEWLVKYNKVAREIFLNPKHYLFLQEAVDRYPFYFPKCFDYPSAAEVGPGSACSEPTPINPDPPRYGLFEQEKRSAKAFLRNRFLYFALYFSSQRFAEETGVPFDGVLDQNEKFFLKEAIRLGTALPYVPPAGLTIPPPQYAELVIELGALPPPPVPSITVTAPNTVSQRQAGYSYPSLWKSVHGPSQVNVSVEKDDGTIIPIANNVPNTGRYVWAVPVDFPPGLYKFSVQGVGMNVGDKSDVYFKIIPKTPAQAPLIPLVYPTIYTPSTSYAPTPPPSPAPAPSGQPVTFGDAPWVAVPHINFVAAILEAIQRLFVR